jgi:transcriptional regulator with XRE-family HTH domain
MKTIAEEIKQKRVEKGLSQQDLANQSKLSLRTIQRIESDETQPREVTLKLLSSVLEIKENKLITGKKSFNTGKMVMDILLFSIINLILMFIAGFFTIDSLATFYSRIAGILLSFFIPYFIVSRTLSLKPINRLFRFVTGYVLYVILLFISQGFENGFFIGFGKGLFFSIIISVFTLYYGDYLFKKNKQKLLN